MMDAALSRMLDDLDEQTSVMSSFDQMARTNAYNKIKKLGREKVVPGLLEELRGKQRAVWPVILLLAELTGKDPVPKQSRGILKKTVDAWLAWGEKTVST